MKKFLLGIVAAAGLAYTRWAAGPIDGTSWEVKIKPDSLFAFSHHGTLRFEQGRLDASIPMASGFTPGSYRAENVAGSVGTVWSAALTEAQRGTFGWQGLIQGDQIQGIAVLWNLAGKPQRFLFKGTRKNG